MPTISVKLDSQSKYTIELNPEYTPKEFIETAQKHIRFVNEIVSGRERINRPESPATPEPDRHNEPPREQISSKNPDTPRKAASSARPKIILAKSLLYVAVFLAFACSGAAIYLWHSDFAIITSEKAMPPPVFKAKIATNPAPGARADFPVTVPMTSSIPAGKKNPPPLPHLSKIIIEARELTWMRIGEDNNPAYEIMLRPGDRLEREASKFAVKIGNAKGVDVTFNNKRIAVKNFNSTRLPRNVVFLKLPRG
jgi:hypothetical protein